ncbi:MAG TPA: hypothetical protein VF093_05995 [Solirubrobacterales bacterium]
MRKRLITTMAVAVAVAVTATSLAVAKKIVVQQGNLKLTVDGTFSPKQLPKSKLAPITLDVKGKVETLDGKHPPALREFVVETDKNGALNAKGLPTCTAAKLNSQDTKNAEKACPNAIVGAGKTDVEIEFAEQPPIVAHSKLLAFNGGVKGGTTTIFIHAFLTVPVPAAVVTTVKVTKVKNGRYGLKSVASVPVIAGGAGSPINFSLKLHRDFTYKGKKQSYFLAKCPDGHLNAKGSGIFSDNTKLVGSVVLPCTPKG